MLFSKKWLQNRPQFLLRFLMHIDVLWFLLILLLFVSIVQTFWAPDSPIQITIVLLVEKIILAMGDELKIYLPPMVQPVLRLFMQDESEQKLVTQKVRVHVHVHSCGLLYYVIT